MSAARRAIPPEWDRDLERHYLAGQQSRGRKAAPPAAPRPLPPVWDLEMDYAYVGRAAVRRQAVAQARRRTILALGGGAFLGGVILAVLLAVLGASAPRTGGGLRVSSYRAAGSAQTLLQALGDVVSGGAVQAAPEPPPAEPEPPAPEPPAAPAGDRPALAPPTPDYLVVAPPSVSAALIDQVLTEYGSPAAGQGAAFYDSGLRYGIDPAYALAFFIHESSAGTKGVARFTKSVGNIRTTPGYRDYQGYRAYDSWEASIEDWYKLIKELYVDGWGKRTVAQIIPTYAPSGDNNDPPSYIASVTHLVDSWQQK